MQRGNRGSGQNIEAIKEDFNVNLTLNILAEKIEESNKKLFTCIGKVNEEIRNIIQNKSKEIQALLEKLMNMKKLNDEKQSTDVLEKLNYNKKVMKSSLPKTSITQNLNQTENMNAGNEKVKIKMWKYKLRTRSDLFFRHHRNKKLNKVFELEIRKEDPTIPKVFLSHIYQEDTKEEKEIKQQLTIKKVKAELQLQNIRANRQLKSLKTLIMKCTHIFRKIFQNN